MRFQADSGILITFGNVHFPTSDLSAWAAHARRDFLNLIQGFMRYVANKMFNTWSPCIVQHVLNRSRSDKASAKISTEICDKASQGQGSYALHLVSSSLAVVYIECDLAYAVLGRSSKDSAGLMGTCGWSWSTWREATCAASWLGSLIGGGATGKLPTSLLLEGQPGYSSVAARSTISRLRCDPALTHWSVSEVLTQNIMHIGLIHARPWTRGPNHHLCPKRHAYARLCSSSICRAYGSCGVSTAQGLEYLCIVCGI